MVLTSCFSLCISVYCDEDQTKVVALSTCIHSHIVILFGVCGLQWLFPFRISTLKHRVCLCNFCFLLLSFLLACRLWPAHIHIKLVSEQEAFPHKCRNMDESLGGMLKLTGPNYSVWKSKMRDMLVYKDLWLPVQYGKDKAAKVDALAWETTSMMSQKLMSYGRR